MVLVPDDHILIELSFPVSGAPGDAVFGTNLMCPVLRVEAGRGYKYTP